MHRTVWATAALLAIVGHAAAENWPAWRGPRGDGVATEKDVPLTWGATENVRWKVALPGPGNGSPVVWGDRLFLTQSLDPKGHRRALLCLDRADGKIRWQRDVAYPDNEPTHATNPFGAATPATDGERVVASFGSVGLACWDLDGKELWRHDLGRLYHIWGNAASPIFYRDLVLLWCGPGDRQFLLAVDKATGKKVWQHDEPGGAFGKDASNWVGSWATPVVANINGRDELILPVPEKVKAFDPATGKELWSCAGLSKLVYASPAVSKDGIVVAFSGYHGPALAVRAGGSGDVTATHRLWLHKTKNPQRIGSPVIVGDHCYLVSEPGTAHAFDLTTGKDVWDRQRTGHATWSSLTRVGDKLLIPDMDGGVTVLAAAPTFEIVRRNAVGREMTRASLAVADGELYLRTYQHLWCIGAK